MLVQVRRARGAGISAVQAVWHNRQDSAGSIVAHPCKKRKD
jgi:hypothetical protein